MLEIASLDRIPDTALANMKTIIAAELSKLEQQQQGSPSDKQL
jgi:hypothetical protein